ncbi:hypothetical protein BC629DRAFT_1542394 [Irpex lacteus]|nr:hypothetical protein BC629DRAFT_1542394 [Irpex lacteus]
MRVTAHGACTDSARLALTALMLNPNCPLHQLSHEERVWTIKFMTLLWGHEKDPGVEIGFCVLEQSTTDLRIGIFLFVFEATLAAATTDRSVTALSVAGMHAYIDSDDIAKLPANFDALVNHARTHPTIRALVLLFDSFDRLKKSLEPFVQVLALAAENIELVLAYEMEKENKAVGVDLVTLEPNDCVDTWTEEQSEGYWGGYLSSQMLQRQLKKKK